MSEAETAMRRAISQINAMEVGIGIDYGAGKDMIALTVLNGKSAEYTVEALEEKIARENPKPLTWLQLTGRDKKPVYVVLTGKEKGTWALFIAPEPNCRAGEFMFTDGPYDCNAESCGLSWNAYDYEPKGVER